MSGAKPAGPAPPIPFVRAEGDPYDVGRRHGAARAADLHAFLDDELCRLNRVLEPPVSMAGLGPVIEAYGDAVAKAGPALAEEIGGLADGAGITREQATLLQLRREIMGFRRVPTTGDCTTYARAGRGAPVLAQTIDLNGNLDDQLGVLEIALTGTPRRSLVITFGGLLGYVGLNSDGLAVGLNIVLGGQWRPGLPPYLAVRQLLDHAGSVDEALAILPGLPLASSRCFTLCDPAKAAYVEVLGDDLHVVEGSETAHTNHYLDPGLAARDELNIFARNSSTRRLDACLGGLAGLPVDAGPEAHFALLSKPPICVPDMGDIRLDRTVAAVVMLPGQGELHVRRGDPSRSATEVFGLSSSSSDRSPRRGPQGSSC